MPPLSVRTYLTPLIHVLMWGLFGVTFLLFQPLMGRFVMPPEFWVKQGVLFVLWIGVFYLTARVTVPRLLFRGRTGWFIGALLATAVALVLLNQQLEASLHLGELMDKAMQRAGGAPRPPRRGVWFDTRSLFTTLLVLGISTSITVVQKWQQDARRHEQLAQQQVSTELALLKAQINPHFFLNTLNNIYALTVIDGEQARAALHRLSRMMRYVLYETTPGSTCLSQEIEFVQDYITLMQLRLTDRVAITFEHPVPVHDVAIAPMLLLPFVENAFKHGVAATAKSFIHIALHQPTPATIELEVCNTRLPNPGTDLAGSNGIGLTNTRRRLDLLYPNRYTLQVTDDQPDEFRVRLTLDVS